MFNKIKKVTAIVTAGAMMAGTFALNANLLGNDGLGSKLKVNAAEFPAVQDSASAVNYATILGRATDFGIVANEFHHNMHMETTIAVNNFYQDDGGAVTDVDFVQGTAQFIIAHIKKGYFSLGSAQRAQTYNVEVSDSVYYANNPNAETADTFSYPSIPVMVLTLYIRDMPDYSG